MSTLENLTGKILSDSEAKAKEILDDANAEAARIVREQVAEAESLKEKILADAKVQAAREEEQIVVGKTLAVRDENLGAKQRMLDKVFAEALRRLHAMPQEQFMKFLTGYLAALDLDGEELILPAERRPADIAEINAALQKAGKKGNLTLSQEDRRIGGGFILAKGGIEQNNTFEALVAYYRYELEGEVIAALY